MLLTNSIAACFLLFSTITSNAQLLSSGNQQLPACAQSCDLLTKAQTACGGQNSATQGIWSCFCQSAYLKPLYNTPNGVCNTVCTNPADNQKVMNWYQGNCGSDNGAKEHPDNGQKPTGTSSTATSAQSSSTGTASSSPNPASFSDFVPPSSTDPTQSGDWWTDHSKWVIMLIVIFLGLLLLLCLAIFLKRRFARRQDALSTSFNEGITTRAVSKGTTSASPISLHPGGHDSPVRTREAFMPYGYGYTRSESRLGSQTNLGDTTLYRGSPLAHEGTTLADTEKSMAHGSTPPSGSKKKRVLVRERSIEDPESPDLEKR